ncbi:MAG: Gfo/Idh/MocA family oxidoreductase [Phycisphaerales bacterium]
MTSERSLTRREFVATGAAIGAAGLLAPRVLAGRVGRVKASELRVGVIGCGGRGTGAVVQALSADPGAVLWAMGDLFPEKIESCLGHVRSAMEELDKEDSDGGWNKKIQVPDDRRFVGLDSYAGVLRSEVDVVLLTTPPAFRPRHLMSSIGAGRHVFCEKPVAVDAPGLRDVFEASRRAEAAGLSLMSGFCWRYQDQVKECFEHLAAGGVGELHTIQTTYNTTGWVAPHPRQDGWSDTEFQLRNWQYFTPISGDHIVEQAVHAIDWIGWAMGDQPPERCWAVGGRSTRPDTPETGNVWDNFSITYEYPGGVRAYHMCRHWPNTPSDNSAYFIGSEGRCVMQPWNGRHEVMGERPWKGTAVGNDMYQREHDVLFKSIREGKPLNDGERMSKTTLLALMGRMAAYTGQVVTWDQAMGSQENLNPGAWAMGPRETPKVAVPGTKPLT